MHFVLNQLFFMEASKYNAGTKILGLFWSILTSQGSSWKYGGNPLNKDQDHLFKQV